MTLPVVSSLLFLILTSIFAAKAGSKLLGGKDLPFTAMAWVVAATALVFRLILGYNTVGYETDIALFKAWAELVNDVGYSRVYHTDVFLDYPPGFLYVLGFLDSIRELFSVDTGSQTFTLMIKLPSIIADIVCGMAVYMLGRKRISQATAFFASAAYLSCPAVLINSAVWGQADSFCLMILMFSLVLLYRERIIPSAALYGLAVICKPQMLIFAPVYLFFTICRKNFKGLVIGIACALLTIILVATPYIQNFDYLWLIEKYKSTMDYYWYYTINAYNMWAMFGKNWASLPSSGIGLFILNWFGPVLATALCGLLMWGGRERKSVVFPAAAVLMSTVYIFSVKMHERYLFPALLFILLTYYFTRDRKMLYIFSGFSFVHYINVAYILYLNNSYVDPMSLQIVGISAAHVVLYLWFMYRVYVNYCLENKLEQEPEPERKQAGIRKLNIKLKGIDYSTDSNRMTRKDTALVIALTAFYAIFAFWNLGSSKTANTSWTPEAGESVTFLAGEDISGITFLPGIGRDGYTNTPVTGSNLVVEISEDGEHWTTAAMTENGYVYDWQHIYFDAGDCRYIRITANNDSVVINEVAAKALSGLYYAELIPVDGNTGVLLDEQDSVPVFESYMDSTYFDEIYHARTAYEHILGVEPYENTHPTLGKLIIALGIHIFGMNPFGWRFMGALFGVLMLPVLYHILKRLLGSSLIAFCATFVFAFDFMHFTQTRIATIDTYAVFFILLMYDAMILFMQMDVVRSPIRKLLVPLAFSGVFMGLGIASKWTVAYGALGLAVLYFVKLISSAVSVDGEERIMFTRKALVLCMWCMLLFVLVPFGIYYAAFLPVTTQPQNMYDVWGRFWAYQTHMFSYHSDLVAEHYFASPWYEWPFVIRNIWYFSSSRVNLEADVSTIVCLGNPITWWTGLAATAASVISLIRKRKAAALTVVVGYAAVMVPWMLVSRLTFVYHYFTAVPFIIIAMAYMVKELSSHPALSGFCAEKGFFSAVRAWQLLPIGFVLISFVMFLLFYPAISGAPASYEYLKGLEWLPDWYFI